MLIPAPKAPVRASDWRHWPLYAHGARQLFIENLATLEIPALDLLHAEKPRWYSALQLRSGDTVMVILLKLNGAPTQEIRAYPTSDYRPRPALRAAMRAQKEDDGWWRNTWLCHPLAQEQQDKAPLWAMAAGYAPVHIQHEQRVWRYDPQFYIDTEIAA